MNLKNIGFVVEEEAYEGVCRVADKVAHDVELVIGKKPVITKGITECANASNNSVMLCATIGKSKIVDLLIDKGVLSADVVESIQGKRETFAIRLLTVDSLPEFSGISEVLLVLGSDKLGTIYGMFTFSEYIGVSAQCYWGDATPISKADVSIEKNIEQISKEPSVKFRGFFINDEWPCFGNWTFGHFGGFTAEMYDHVFEFLLRMKGNYLWPAMWTSSFPLDGPGNLNEELADIYGITIAYSHHEPCLRASEEWDKVRGEGTRYGNEWNYYTNAEGLSNYWADALKRSGKYNHLITIGMRGERDSSMLGPDATLKDNIDLLKDIIKKQRELIKEHVNEDVDSVPQLLALYKEVEAYFYGDENTEGLDKWDELENVIFMLCEDNFGHMRTLPTEKMREHKGGYGMYYHFDYHGGPVSYEWMPSTTLATTWEQMTMAYEYGIKDVWIVNVGDLKGNEIALQYFLTLAYDFDQWGSTAPNSWRRYLRQWTQQVFPSVTTALQNDMVQLYVDLVALNATRRPEALHPMIYHPSHYGETDSILAWTDRIEAIARRLHSELMVGDVKVQEAFYSLLYYPAMNSINLIRMHLYAGKNEYYARQGRKIANAYGKMMNDCILEDRRLAEEFGAFRDGKWKGMELEQHVGFTSWNDDGWKYPVRMYVEPVTKPRMSVSRTDHEELYVKVYGEPRCIKIDDFCSDGVGEAYLEISNDGVDSLNYDITVVEGNMPEWLSVSPMKGTVDDLQKVTFVCNKAKLGTAKESVRLMISDGDTRVAVLVEAQKTNTEGLPKGTFLPSKNVLVMPSNRYCCKTTVGNAAFEELEEYGRSGYGMKVFPTTLNFKENEEKPQLKYWGLIPESGEFNVEVWMTPTNSLENRRPLCVELGVTQSKAGSADQLVAALASDNAGQKTVDIVTDRQILTVLDENYRGGENSCAEWCKGVLDQIRVVKTTTNLQKGLAQISIGAMEAGLVVEKILVYPSNMNLPVSYLGPKDSMTV